MAATSVRRAGRSSWVFGEASHRGLADRTRDRRFLFRRVKSASATISMRYAERILEAAAASGVSRADLLRAAPLSPRDWFGDQRIGGGEYYSLWGAAMDGVGDSRFPMRVAASTGIETYDVFGFTMMTS